MNKLMLFVTALVLLSVNAAAGGENAKTTVFMAGDSTMAIKEVKDYPETGWGVPFAYFFDDGIAVINYAKNGRSTRTFRDEGLWQKIVDGIKPGDFVFIQFGHNDESEKKKDRYTTPAQYKANLLRYIAEARKLKAKPILLSPISRRYFDETGKIKHTHTYTPICLEVAKETGVDFIDMDEVTRKYLQALGDRDSAVRFMHIPPQTHPNYPVGVRDDTHLNQLGAREVAQLVLAELKTMGHPLALRLRTPDPKHLKLKY